MNAFKTIARAAVIVAALGTASVAAAAEPTVAADKAAVSAPAQSRDGLNRRVRIHNNTGWTMLRFYASDSRITDWQEDMLAGQAVGSGETLTVNFNDGSGACTYSFRAVFDDGDEAVQDIDVCSVTSVTYN